MEHLLHYVWKHKLFPLKVLQTTHGLPVEVIDSGLQNPNAGPDFFNAKLKIDGTVWVGNIEIHTYSSDWFRHGHHCDKAYDSVILHVVSEADTEVTRTNGERIPQLLLTCSENVKLHYHELCVADQYPACYPILASLSKLTIHSWLTALQTERLEQKAQLITQRLELCNRNWEDAFFITLARNFGFGLNGDAFETWAGLLPFRAMDKHRNNLFQIEAFFYGLAGLLEETSLKKEQEDEYSLRLCKEFRYLQRKFEIGQGMDVTLWRFLRLRPDNFPHIRLAQLAYLYQKGDKLFSRLLEAETLKDVRTLLDTRTSPYWENHYLFGRPSSQKEKTMGERSKDLIIINTVVPFLYTYGLHKADDRMCERAGCFLKEFTINIDSEIRYFLEQAVEAADIVAKAHSIVNDNYAALFNSVDLSGMNEVLLWRKYSLNSEATSYHFVVSYLQRNGGGNVAFTRSMADSYLMKNGLPIYADNADYQGDGSYETLFANRDPRMDQTILKTGDLLSDDPNLIEYIKNNGKGYFYRAPIFEGQVENSNATGYCLRKGLHTSGSMQPTKESYTGCPIFRAAEAYLNYLEAYYELHGDLQGNCDTYWKALRTRAGVDTDYQKTIDNTIMEKEKNDWGSYSTGTQVNATLYNIRRERRIELAAEGHRMNDLKRWRALDQVQNVHIQGCNFWESIYRLYTNPQPEDAASTLAKITLTEYGTTEETANVSSRNDPYAEGKYLLPYRKNKANIGFDGLNWNTAKYLYPISNREFRLTTAVAGSGDFDSSSIYQNPGWSKHDGTLPVGD